MLKPDPELFSASAIREWTHPTTILPDASDLFAPFGFGFAMPWEVILGKIPSVTSPRTKLSTPIIMKTGGIGTYASIIAFHPATELGVAVLVSYHDPRLALETTTSAYEVANVTFNFEAVTKILGDLIPEVSAINSQIISSLYSGAYACDHTDPVLSLGLNTTVQVIGGSVTITATPSLPDNGLIAAVNLSLLVDGVPRPQALPPLFSSSLVLKNGNENTFWAYPGLDCFSINVLSNNADARRPNYPGSFDLYELQFDPSKGLLRWPSLGAVCRTKFN